jgi:hypothetical protein
LPQASRLKKEKSNPPAPALDEMTIIPTMWQNTQEHDFSLDN